MWLLIEVPSLVAHRLSCPLASRILPELAEGSLTTDPSGQSQEHNSNNTLILAYGKMGIKFLNAQVKENTFLSCYISKNNNYYVANVLLDI